jgi:hypothetical protein
MLPSDKDMVNLIMPVTDSWKLDYSVPPGYMYHRGKCFLIYVLDYIMFSNFLLALDKMFSYICFNS